MLGHGELRWYAFGLFAGVMNVRSNGLALGWKKTLGKVLQPINAYTRYPEYQLFHKSISTEIHRQSSSRLRILDIGSPKLFGFYLAWRYTLKACLTDINEKDIEEYACMWSGLRHAAAGEAVVERQDGRALTYSDRTFDVVYAMSAIEHVEGERADSLAIQEGWRTLKPGGMMILSVPYGDKYIEQSMVGFSYTARQVDRDRLYFFQRIYDRGEIERRLLAPLDPPPTSTEVLSAYRMGSFGLARAYHKVQGFLGVNAGGLLGPVKPWVSLVLNRHCPGYASGFIASYGPVHSLADVYPDAILICRKPPADA